MKIPTRNSKKSHSRPRKPARGANPRIAHFPRDEQPLVKKEKKIMPQAGAPTFPVVGVGASAGGLEAFARLLEALPVDPGMAFVLVPHLDPTHESAMTELLSRVTQMRVFQVHDGIRLK